MDPGIIFFLLIIAIIVGALLLGYVQQKNAKRTAEELLKKIEIRENTLILPRRMMLVKGRLTLRGYWSSSGRSRSYHVDRKFTGRSEFEGEKIELKPERFTLIMGKDEEALIDVPAYLITEPEFKDILIVPIIPSYDFEIGKGSLEVSKDMEFAHARIELNEWGFSGKLYTTVQKCRGARIELKTKKPKVVEKLAETRESTEFRKEFLREKLVIICHRKATDPRHFAQLLGRKVFIEGHGEYTLELTLDVPFGKDVHDSTILRVEPSEGIPEGTIRAEVVV